MQRSRTLAYSVTGDVIEVYDLDFAAFCHMSGLCVADMIEDSRSRGRFKFIFRGTSEKIAQLSVAYTNSECAKFADAVRRLKKAVRVEHLG
jgi:hypothetical protein